MIRKVLILDREKTEKTCTGHYSNVGENDLSTADTEDSIVISDDAFNQDDSTLELLVSYQGLFSSVDLTWEG